MSDLVSIITPLYNSSDFIGRTIESIQKQSYKNWELLITDDCSNDNSVNIVESYHKKDNRIKLFRLTKNSGAAVARNNSIKEANGRFIAFCDSDDRWKTNKLEKQVNYMLAHNYLFTYGSYDVVDENNNLKGTFTAPPKVNYSSMLKTCSVGCLTACYDAHGLGKIFMPDIRKRQDYGLWLKILKKVKFAYGINEPFAIYTARNNSISSNKLKAAQYQWRIYREVEKIGFIKSLYYFTFYAVNGFLKPN